MLFLTSVIIRNRPVVTGEYLAGWSARLPVPADLGLSDLTSYRLDVFSVLCQAGPDGRPEKPDYNPELRGIDRISG